MLSHNQGSLVYVVLKILDQPSGVMVYPIMYKDHDRMNVWRDLISAENWAAENIGSPFTWEVIGIPQ